MFHALPDVLKLVIDSIHGLGDHSRSRSRQFRRPFVHARRARHPLHEASAVTFAASVTGVESRVPRRETPSTTRSPATYGGYALDDPERCLAAQ